MQVYLAGNYGRRLELCEYRKDLEHIGIRVQARWLNGEHQVGLDGKPIGELGEKLVEGESQEIELRRKFLADDIHDCSNAQLVINFTSPPPTYSRGGRHVEYGIAMILGIPQIIVGPRENLFHYHDKTKQFDTWVECLNYLRGR